MWIYSMNYSFSVFNLYRATLAWIIHTAVYSIVYKYICGIIKSAMQKLSWHTRSTHLNWLRENKRRSWWVPIRNLPLNYLQFCAVRLWCAKALQDFHSVVQYVFVKVHGSWKNWIWHSLQINWSCSHQTSCQSKFLSVSVVVMHSPWIITK